jgi:hypothetical protein
MDAAGTPCPVTRQQKAELERARAEERERTAERQDDSNRVAHSNYAAVDRTAAPAVVVVEQKPAAPAYHFVPMAPIKD